MKIKASSLIFSLLLCACAASSPPPDKKLLLDYQGPLPAAAAATQRPQLVVRGVSVPDYLERRGLAYRSAPNQLNFYSGVEWAERPAKGITRWVALALAAARNDYQVLAFTTGDHLPEVLLGINLESAEPGPDNILHLRGGYNYFVNATQASGSGRFDADAPLSANTAEGSVAALQLALDTAVKKLAAELPSASAAASAAAKP